MINEVLQLFPLGLRSTFKLLPVDIVEKVCEIRLRVGREPSINIRDGEFVLSTYCESKYIITSECISGILSQMCQNSMYAVQEEIKNGFITIKGGHRVGIVGRVIRENNKVSNIKFFSGLNIRIARQIIGSANKMISQIVDEDSIKNTLIVSPPGKGKTTILRDIIRQISNGIPEMNFKGLSVGLIDERSEIAACFNGVPQNDIGIRTDVLDNAPKSEGIRLLTRSMAPKVICTDEIFSIEDADSILEAIASGVKVVCTAHGNDMEDLSNKEGINKLMDKKVFDNVIFL